jgi:acid phosphatase (class A)
MYHKPFLSSACVALGLLLAACVAPENAGERAAAGATKVSAPQAAATAPTTAPAPASAAPATSPAGPPRAPPVPGYLPAGTIDMLRVMPPAPTDGDARDEADRRIFRETRALRGTPRWEMAADDAELGTAAMLRHFSCSLDIELTAQQAPKLVRILQRATRDASQSMAGAKDHYRRPRPYFVQPGEICRPRDELGASFDYPSGHTTAGWSWALVLAQVAPDRASGILARGRAIGDSRVVCGVHNASAVAASRLLTGATIAVSAATAEYQQDLAAARTELAALRAAPHTTPAPARCEAEAALLRQPVAGH